MTASGPTPSVATIEDAPLAAFIEAARAALADGRFASLVLSKPRVRGDAPATLRIRRVALKGRPMLSIVAAHPTRDLARNVDIEPGLAEVAAQLDPRHPVSFAHATLHAKDADTHLLMSRKGHAAVRRHAHVDAPKDASDAGTSLPPHDRARTRRLALDLPFLTELGITDAGHRLVPAMARKWRQIDKFLEVLDHALDALTSEEGMDAARALRVVDYGCGKGYLTFAVHEHLHRRFGIAPQVTGVELRAELVDFCNGVAARAGCIGLSFVQGDLRSVVPAEMDVMIALHACDTATDHAIDLGVRAGAKVLICAPCCHKELRPQIGKPARLAGLLRHGVHLGQEAEMVTDSMRALLLETCGYEARVFEFVSLEHTSKNKMILARRRGATDATAERARTELADLKDFYGIRAQCLQTLLARRARSPADRPQACQTP